MGGGKRKGEEYTYRNRLRGREGVAEDDREYIYMLRVVRVRVEEGGVDKGRGVKQEEEGKIRESSGEGKGGGTCDRGVRRYVPHTKKSEYIKRRENT